MKTSLIAFFNQGGVAIASSANYSIWPISKNLPMAIVIDGNSSFPWKDILTDFISTSDTDNKYTFQGLKNDIEGFINEVYNDKINQENTPVFIIGYENGDIYSSFVELRTMVGSDGSFYLNEVDKRKVTINDTAFFTTVGDFLLVKPMMAGASDEILGKMLLKISGVVDTYKNILQEKLAADENIDQRYTDCLKAFDPNQYAEDFLGSCVEDALRSLKRGIDTFSIEEMVDYAETLVNTEAGLENLKDQKNIASVTKEIAVITLPEGFTWLKHPIFAI